MKWLQFHLYLVLGRFARKSSAGVAGKDGCPVARAAPGAGAQRQRAQLLAQAAPRGPRTVQQRHVQPPLPPRTCLSPGPAERVDARAELASRLLREFAVAEHMRRGRGMNTCPGCKSRDREKGRTGPPRASSGPPLYQGASLIRKRPPLGPYGRPMPGTVCWSWKGGVVF